MTSNRVKGKLSKISTSVIHATGCRSGGDDYSSSACGKWWANIEHDGEMFAKPNRYYKSLSDRFTPVVTCQACVDALTPGSSLYKKTNCPATEIPVDKKYFPAIMQALKDVDYERRHSPYDTNSCLNAAMVALMEALNLHLPKEKCSSCRGGGKVPHTHSGYCWRDGGYGGEDYLGCDSSDEQCSSCRGTGFISEELLRK